jgi:hypothetical protein
MLPVGRDLKTEMLAKTEIQSEWRMLR